MALARTMTHTSRKPNWAPALTLAATLPGSTYAMAATKAGPSRYQLGRSRTSVSCIN